MFERILMFSVTCNLNLPKQPCEGTISVRIKPDKTLGIGDTDISGLVEHAEKLQVYVSNLNFILEIKLRIELFRLDTKTDSCA